MPDKSHKDEPPKVQESPFPLEIIPNKLVVPPDGVLEVKIRNSTEKSLDFTIHFDSFFFLMTTESEFCMEREGCSISTLCANGYLQKEEIVVFKIGYLNGQYTARNSHYDEYKSWCGYPTITVEAPPAKRIYYNHENPEGFVDFVIDDSKQTRKMELFLEKETEQFKTFRKQFLKIRKDQELKSRWGHILVNDGYKTIQRYKDDAGKLHSSSSIKKIDYPEFANDSSIEELEEDIVADLEQIGKMTDEEILKLKKERRKKVIDDRKRKKQKKIEDEPRLREERRIALEKKFEELGKLKKSVELEVAAEEAKGETAGKSKSSISKVTEASSTQKVKPVEPIVKKSKEEETKKAGKMGRKKKANPCCVLL